MERRQRHERDGGGAVRRRHDAARHVADVVGVHLGDHEGDVGLHAERRRLVDDARTALDRPRCPLERERVVDVDDHEVETVEAAVGEDLADDLAVLERQRPTLGAW